MFREWEELPGYMKTEAVRPYHEKIRKKKYVLVIKRIFDFFAATIMLFLFLPAMLIISFLIAKDTEGGVFFCQERITQYGRKFRIIKFRTMAVDKKGKGTQVTLLNDCRVTKIGRILRKYRLDELPQLINIIMGDMSFCGTRPESTYYVKKYNPEMFATLLLPAGLTSEASIRYKDEAELLATAEDADKVYLDKVLPEKMKYNLESIQKFTLFREMATLIKTILAVVR
ncbi:MAG: sugar transferase [Lachnospiraceae bacterium]|nr:sugar transferase [Lachnospiraceae bacterium]